MHLLRGSHPHWEFVADNHCHVPRIYKRTCNRLGSSTKCKEGGALLGGGIIAKNGCKCQSFKITDQGGEVLVNTASLNKGLVKCHYFEHSQTKQCLATYSEHSQGLAKCTLLLQGQLG